MRITLSEQGVPKWIFILSSIWNNWYSEPPLVLKESHFKNHFVTFMNLNYFHFVMFITGSVNTS